MEDCAVGWDWLKRGTVGVAIRDNETAARIETSLDYRKAGFRKSVPARIDLSRCRRVHGMNVYENQELVERKLNTMVGSSARHKPRDVYDTGWLVHEHPELISERQAAGLKAWLSSLSDRDKADFRQEMKGEQVIGRADVDKAWRMLEEGIRRLTIDRGPGTKHEAGRGASGGGTGGDGTGGDGQNNRGESSFRKAHADAPAPRPDPLPPVNQGRQTHSHDRGW